MSFDRLRLWRNGPIVFVRWDCTARRFLFRPTRGDRWRELSLTLPDLDLVALAEIRQAAEQDEHGAAG